MSQEKIQKFLRDIKTRNTKKMLFLILVLGLVLRLIFFSGMGTSDDLAYSRYAYNVNKGIEPDSVLTLSTRLGIIYTTAFSYTLFGVNDFSSVIFILLTSIGNIILVYYFGKLLFDKNLGLMAAFLLSIFPLEIIYSTRLLTDIPSAFFMSLGVYLFLNLEQSSKPSLRGNEIKSKNTIYYFLSGIFIGVGYLIRETAILIALFFLLYALLNKRIKKEYFMTAAGFLLIFVIEIILFYKMTGNPLFKFTAVQDYLREGYIEHNYFGRLQFPQGLFHYPYIILTDTLITPFYVLIFIAIAYFLIIKKKETYTIMLWFVALLLYLSFGSTSFSHYLPFRAVTRYLSIITIPGILLLSFFLTGKNKFIKNIIAPISLILLFVASIISSSTNINNYALENLKTLYPYLKNLKKITYIDARSKMVIDYLSGYNNKLDMKEFPEDFGGVKDSFIVINKPMIKNLREANPKIKFPAEIDSPSQRWTIIKEIGKDENSKAIIYYTSQVKK